MSIYCVQRGREDLSSTWRKSQFNWPARAHTNEIPTKQTRGTDEAGPWQPWLQREGEATVENVWKELLRCLSGRSFPEWISPAEVWKGDGQFTLWGTTCFGTCDFLLSLELNSGRMNWTSNTGWFMAEAWFLQMSWEIWGVWNIAGDGYIAQGWLLSLESVSQCCIYSVVFSALVQLPPPPKERSVTSGWKAAHLGNST